MRLADSSHVERASGAGCYRAPGDWPAEPGAEGAPQGNGPLADFCVSMLRPGASLGRALSRILRFLEGHEADEIPSSAPAATFMFESRLRGVRRQDCRLRAGQLRVMNAQTSGAGCYGARDRQGTRPTVAGRPGRGIRGGLPGVPSGSRRLPTCPTCRRGKTCVSS